MFRVLTRRARLVAVAAVIVGSWLLATAGQTAEFRLATFRCEVTPPLGYPLYPDYQPVVQIEHPLLAKGIVLDDGDRRYVLCALDWGAVCNSTYDLFRRKVAEGAGTDVANVAVHTLHQHTAPMANADAVQLVRATPDPPRTDDPVFFAAMAERLGVAVKESLTRLQPFDRIGAGQGRVEQVASSRRLIGPDGKAGRPRWSVVRGADVDLRDAPEGVIDPLLKTITLACGEKPLVRLHYYATHPQSYYGDARVTYDFPGMAREALEKQEGVFQVYFTGCAGDVTVGKYNDGTPASRAQLAARVLAGMEAAIAATRFMPVETIQWRTADVTLPLYEAPQRTLADSRARLANPQEKSGVGLGAAAWLVAYAQRLDHPLALSSLQIGRIHVLALPGECLIDYQLFAQRTAPDDFVAVAAYQDSGPGYICTDRAFVEGGYEPTDTVVGPGSERLLKEAITALLGVR